MTLRLPPLPLLPHYQRTLDALGPRPLCYRAPGGPPVRARIVEADRERLADGIALTPFVSPPVLEPADVRAQLDAIEAARGRDVVADPLPVLGQPVNGAETPEGVSLGTGEQADCRPASGEKVDSARTGVVPVQLAPAELPGTAQAAVPERATLSPVAVAVLAFVLLGWLAAAALRTHDEQREAPSLQDGVR